MYCEAIQRWIPIQLSWIQGLSQNYYTVHFTVLFRQFFIPGILKHEREDLAISVVDFSQAQKNGFSAAFTKTFGGTEDDAIKRLKGCREHFRQSVTRVARNRAVLAASEEVCSKFLFLRSCTSNQYEFTHLKLYSPSSSPCP
jgi:hypothetical protein